MIINIFPIPEGPFSLREISKEINCSYVKDNINIAIHNISPLNAAKEGELSFLDNVKYISKVQNCRASAIIVPSKFSYKLNTNAVLLESDNAYASYAKALQKFYPIDKEKKKERNAAKKNIIEPTVKIADMSNIEDNVHIKEGTNIKSFSNIGPNVIIGENCFIGSNVNIANTIIGNNCFIQSGTVIGGDGFGYAPFDGEFIKIPQIGIVKIGNNVEIGANCTIDKGSLIHTEIRSGVKIDNLVHIAHNVVIKENTVIAGQTGIAGSTTIGKNVMIGGQVGIAGHIVIGNNVKIGAQAGVTKSVNDNMTISGTPATSLNTYLKKTILLNKMIKKKKKK